MTSGSISKMAMNLLKNANEMAYCHIPTLVTVQDIRIISTAELLTKKEHQFIPDGEQ